MPLAFRTFCVTPAWRLRQVSAVQKKWYARRYNIGTFNRAFEETGNVFFFFSVTHSYNFQVCVFFFAFCVCAYMRIYMYACTYVRVFMQYVCVHFLKVRRNIFQCSCRERLFPRSKNGTIQIFYSD